MLLKRTKRAKYGVILEEEDDDDDCYITQHVSLSLT
jgi:hypothetical protein